MNDEYIEKYFDYSLQKYIEITKDSSCCPTADCRYAFIYDDKRDV